jgi:hypothetical protein
MHDTAVGSANFTECVPVPTDAEWGSPPIEGGLGKEPTHHVATASTTQQRPASGMGLRALTRVATTDCVRYDSFQ